MSADEILNHRKNKFLKIGRNKGFMNKLDDLSSLNIQKNNFYEIIKTKKILIPLVGFILIFLVSIAFLL